MEPGIGIGVGLALTSAMLSVLALTFRFVYAFSAFELFSFEIVSLIFASFSLGNFFSFKFF